MRAGIILAVALASTILCVPSAAQAGRYTFRTLLVPPSFTNPSPNNSTFAYGINNHDQVVGYYWTCCVVQSGGFSLRDGNYSQIIVPGEAHTLATGINARGQIVGYYFGVNSSGFGANPSGFLLNNSTFTTIVVPTATSGTTAFGLNDSGEIVGWYGQGAATHGFIYNRGQYETIDDPLGTGTYATGINSKGDVVGWYTDASGGDHGFFYNGSSFITLDDPNAAPGKTDAIGINDEGDVVGSYVDAANAAHGFLWNGISYTTLDDPLATSTAGTYAFGINDAGEIVGYYLNSNGEYGFLAKPSR